MRKKYRDTYSSIHFSPNGKTLFESDDDQLVELPRHRRIFHRTPRANSRHGFRKNGYVSSGIIGSRSLILTITCMAIFGIALYLAKHPMLADVPISRFLSSQLGRNKPFDEIMISFDTCFTFSGVVVLASLWGAWFRTNFASARGQIILGVVFSAAATLISRVLQHTFHAHQRPYYDLSYAFHAYFSDKLNTWNSFPSDHVSAFAGLCAVAWLANAPFKYFVICWTALIELARVYVGAHYFSDILGGAALGLGFVCAAQREWLIYLGSRVARLAGNHAAGFYMLAFFCSYQIATLGSDIRTSLSGLKGVISRGHG